MSNEFYDHVGTPPTGSQLSSALIRAEFAKVEAAFDKMPSMSTGANKMLVVNGTGTSVITTDAPDINGGTIDGAVIGGISPASGAFTSLSSSSGALNGTIGATTPNTGVFTSLSSSSGALNGTIGGTTPAAGTFTTLSASSSATVPTVAVDTSSTAAASTAWVLAQAGTSNPIINGTAAAGSSTRWARQDHVHPTDTTRAPINSPTFTGSVTLPGDPASNLQAATKQYVDNAATGIDNHQAVAVATTANITLSGLQTIDGYTTLAGDRVLVKNQSTASQNGVYDASAGAWSRSADWDTTGEVKQGSYVFVNNGTTQAKTGWTQQTSGTITIGTTNQVFQQFSAANSYSAGTGLTLGGNVFSITAPVTAALGGTGATSYAVGDILQADTASTLAKLAAVATGNVLISGGVGTVSSWGKVGLTTHISGTLSVGNGGTGATTLTGILKGNGASAFTAATAGTDYSAGTSALATGILKSTTSTGALSIAAAGTDYQAPIGTISGIVKGNGANALTAATASDITTAIGTTAVTNATNATNATNTGITEDTATAVAVYPTWVTANTGNLPQKTTSTKLSFVPSTGVLTATSFSGAGTGLTGTASSLTAGTASATAAAVTFNNGGAGDASGTTFNGGTARTISYNTVGAAASSHSHGNITNAGAIGVTANLPIITTTSGVLTTGSFGTTANTFCQGNDARLSDTRSTTNALTINSGGAGAASGSTFNGSTALTISYNTVGAPSTTGTNASGSWNITSATTSGLNSTALGTAQTWTASQRGTQTTNNTLSYDLAVTNNVKSTPTAGGTLTFTNIASATGQSGFILFVNGANYAISAAATTKVTSSLLGTISTTGTYLMSYYCDGTNVYVAASGALA